MEELEERQLRVRRSKTCKRGRRIAADKKDSLAIKRKLKTSIDPFNPDVIVAS